MAKPWQERETRLIGEEKVDLLFGKTVMVCGLGGVGGSCAEALCRAGIGRLILIDNDTVNETNRNRQAFACLSTEGKKKTEAARIRLSDINPDCTLVLLDRFLTPESIPSLLEENAPDYVVDCIDNVAAKTALAVVCSEKNIPLIASMGTGNKLDPTRLRIDDISKTSVCPLARVMRKRLRDAGVGKQTVLWSDEIPITPGDEERTPASVSFVPPAAGLIIAGRVVCDLINL